MKRTRGLVKLILRCNLPASFTIVSSLGNWEHLLTQNLRVHGSCTSSPTVTVSCTVDSRQWWVRYGLLLVSRCLQWKWKFGNEEDTPISKGVVQRAPELDREWRRRGPGTISDIWCSLISPKGRAHTKLSTLSASCKTPPPSRAINRPIIWHIYFPKQATWDADNSLVRPLDFPEPLICFVPVA